MSLIRGSCGGTLGDLGLRRDNLRPVIGYALVFAGVQFSLTLWGYALPAAEDWVPLLVMALVVGVFESVFFRGFLQGRLTGHLGPFGSYFASLEAADIGLPWASIAGFADGAASMDATPGTRQTKLGIRTHAVAPKGDKPTS